MPRKKSAKVSLADVVREFGPVAGGKKLTPKRAHVAGAALRDMFPTLTGAAGSSLANHMYQANLSRQREGADAFPLEEMVEALKKAFPALATPEPEELAKPAPPPPVEKFQVRKLERPMKNLTAMDVNRSDYPPGARPYGDVVEDLNHTPAYAEPKMPNKKAAAKGGGHDKGYGRGGGTGSRHMSLRKALTGHKPAGA